MQFCNKCWRRIIPITAINKPCPSSDCAGTAVHIDDDIGIAVQILNRKGWRTTDSCSGHPDVSYFTDGLETYWNKDSELYIRFDKIYDFESIPDGFMLIFTNDEQGLRRSVLKADIPDVENPIASQIAIWDLSTRLLNWAETLPVNDAELERDLPPDLIESIKIMQTAWDNRGEDSFTCDCESAFARLQADISMLMNGRVIDPVQAWHLQKKYLRIEPPGPIM